MSDKQNYNIAGSGSLPGADYNGDIHISGSGRVNGDAVCDSFHAAGSGHVCGSLTCRNEFHVSGSGHVDGNLEANSCHIAGSCHINGDVVINDNCHAGGSFHVASLRCRELHISGLVSSDRDVTAEEIKIDGAVKCGGLINAENILVRMNGDCTADSIGGSKITVARHADGPVGFFSRLFGREGSGHKFRVNNTIEGDEIYLENVTAASVMGRIVKIGPGCKIGYISYSEGIEIDEASEVERYELVD